MDLPENKHSNAYGTSEGIVQPKKPWVYSKRARDCKTAAKLPNMY